MVSVGRWCRGMQCSKVDGITPVMCRMAKCKYRVVLVTLGCLMMRRFQVTVQTIDCIVSKNIHLMMLILDLKVSLILLYTKIICKL